jgi:hypothetical protein
VSKNTDVSKKDRHSKRSINEIRPVIAASVPGLGMGIGLLTTSWSNWLHGDQPDLYDGNHILFLRSNIESTRDPKSYHNRTGDMAMNVDASIDILIPVFTAQYHIGSYYKGTKIDSEVGARRAVRDHIAEGREMWAVMHEISESQPQPRYYQKIVANLYEHYVESPMFRLMVSPRSPLKDKLPEPMQAGTYDAIVGGYFILMKLPRPIL